MTRRAILARLFHVNDSLFVLVPVIICANGGTNSAPHRTTNDSAFTTTYFGSDRCAYTTSDRTT
jgi:hypothetical protein